MENINLSADYFDHIKTRRLVAVFGEVGELYPLRLWAWCGRLAPDGCLKDYNISELETVMGYRGEPGKLAQCLLDAKIRIIEEITCRVFLTTHLHAHDFGLMNGHILAYKQRATNAAKARWSKMRKHTTSNAQARSKQSPNPRVLTQPHVVLKDGTDEALRAFMSHFTQSLKTKTGHAPDSKLVRKAYGKVVGYLKQWPDEQAAMSEEIDKAPSRMTQAWYVALLCGQIEQRMNVHLKAESERIGKHA